MHDTGFDENIWPQAKYTAHLDVLKQHFPSTPAEIHQTISWLSTNRAVSSTNLPKMHDSNTLLHAFANSYVSINRIQKIEISWETPTLSIMYL